MIGDEGHRCEEAFRPQKKKKRETSQLRRWDGINPEKEDA